LHGLRWTPGVAATVATCGVAGGLLVAHANKLNALALACLGDFDDWDADNAKGVLDALAPQRLGENGRAVHGGVTFRSG